MRRAETLSFRRKKKKKKGMPTNSRSSVSGTFSTTPACRPVPHAAAEAMRLYAQQAEDDAYLHTGWYSDIEKLRVASAAPLINAHRDEIAFVKNTSEGISIVANGIDWQWGDRIVTTAVEYPANIYPWMERRDARRASWSWCRKRADANGPAHVPLEKILEEAARPQTRLVTLSHVEYASGQRHDLAKIGRVLPRRTEAALASTRSSRSACCRWTWQAMKIDYLAADGHKWLLGPGGGGHLLLPPRADRAHAAADDRLDERGRCAELRRLQLHPPPRRRPLRVRHPQRAGAAGAQGVGRPAAADWAPGRSPSASAS